MKLYCPVLAILFVIAISGVTGALICNDHSEACKEKADTFLQKD